MSDSLTNLIREHKLPCEFKTTVERWYAPVAEAIAKLADDATSAIVIGVQGCQGSGKSTLSEFLKFFLEHEHRKVTAVLSIDDFYLTLAERRALSKEIHPLLATRGVPGTHDIELALSTISALKTLKSGESHDITRFNKAIDDRESPANFDSIAGPVDVIIFEGWCVGLNPQSEQSLANPVNMLEADEDPDGIWRRFVNDALTTQYSSLFNQLDALAVIQAPSFTCVREWRLLQEQKLADKLRFESDEAKKNIMNEAQIIRFISHYQRLTEHALATLPDKADWLLTLDSNHNVTQLTTANV